MTLMVLIQLLAKALWVRLWFLTVFFSFLEPSVVCSLSSAYSISGLFQHRAPNSSVFLLHSSQSLWMTAVIPLLMQGSITTTIATRRERVYLTPCYSSRLLFIIAGKLRWQGLDVGSLSHGQDTEIMNEWSDAQFIQSTISCLVNGATHSEQFSSSIKIIKMIPHRPVPRLTWSR